MTPSALFALQFSRIKSSLLQQRDDLPAQLPGFVKIAAELSRTTCHCGQTKSPKAPQCMECHKQYSLTGGTGSYVDPVAVDREREQRAAYADARKLPSRCTCGRVKQLSRDRCKVCREAGRNTRYAERKTA